MNRTYRLVFNEAAGLWQAVAETAKACGKGRGSKAVVCAALATLALGAPWSVLAQTITYTNGETGNNVLSSGTYTLTVNGTDAAAESGLLAGSLSIIKAGTGTLTLTNNGNSYSGTTTISAGTLQAGTDNAFSPTSAVTVASGAALDVNGTTQTIGSLAGAGNVTLSGLGVLFVGYLNTSTTFSGVISGNGGLDITGTGTLTLSGANTYTGGSYIGSGTLQAGAANVFGNDNQVYLVSGATLGLNGYSQSIGDLGGAGNVTLGGSATTVLTTGGDNNSTTFSGVISGAGGLTKAGTGTFTLSGANTYTGATTVAGGTLVAGNANAFGDNSAVTVDSGATLNLNGISLAIGSLSGAGNVALGGPTGVTLSLGADNTSTTFSGAISGNSVSSLDKVGTGTLILNGNSSSFSGTVNVGQGTLEVGDAGNPSAILGNSSSLVQVAEAGTLRGHGTIGGSVDNTGTVAPGGTIGTLTVDGNYTQSGIGTLSIEVSPAQASQLSVGGTASLDGALQLIYDPGTYSAKTYTLVSAAGGVTGKFATVSSSNLSYIGSLTPSVVYTGNTVDLILAGGGNFVIAPSDASIYTALGTATLLGAQAMDAALLDRSDIKPDSGTPWVTLTGTYTRLGGTGGAPGFLSQRYGFLAGHDRKFGDATAGIAFGYDHADISEQGTGDSGTIDALRLALYGNRWVASPVGPVNLSGTAGIGLDRLAQKRPFGSLGTAQGDHTGQEFNLGTQASLPLSVGGFTVTPHAGLRYAYFHANGFGESGAGGQDLDVGTDTAQSLQPYVGLTLGKRLGSQDRPVDAQLSVGYARELLDTDRALGVSAQDGTPFTAAGVSLPRSYLTAGLSVTMHPAKHLDISLRYDALFNTSHARARQASVNVAYRF